MKVNHYTSEICSECKGSCCKKLPGSYFSINFGYTKEEIYINLKQALSSGNYAVDWYDGDPIKDDYSDEKFYFIRPKTKSRLDVIYDPTYGGECIFLNEEGCSLPVNKRPVECRLLKPDENKVFCESFITKRESSITWIPFHDMIHQIVKEIDINEYYRFIVY